MQRERVSDADGPAEEPDAAGGLRSGTGGDGAGELYTKDAARDLVFAANQAGCAFLGRPLVEATGSLRNFRVQAQIGGTDEETAFRPPYRSCWSG